MIELLRKAAVWLDPLRMPKELVSSDVPFTASDGSHERCIFIDSAEGVTQFSGFTKESNPEAYARLQQKLGQLAKDGPTEGSVE